MQSKKLSDKLIGVERAIEVHNMNGEVIGEIIINVSADELKKVVSPLEDDPELYDGYELNKEQLIRLNELLKNKVEVKSDLYSYFLVANGVYNW